MGESGIVQAHRDIRTRLLPEDRELEGPALEAASQRVEEWLANGNGSEPTELWYSRQALPDRYRK